MANTAPLGGEDSDACAHGGRHEQQSVAMALSAAAHHSFDKVEADDEVLTVYGHRRRTGPWRLRTELYGDRERPRAAGEAVFFELFDEDTAGVAARGSR